MHCPTSRHRHHCTIRITADEFAVHHVLWPAIERFLPDYPDIVVELPTDYGRTDIVSDRYDAGVRRGRLVSQNMIAVPISADSLTMAKMKKRHGYDEDDVT